MAYLALLAAVVADVALRPRLPLLPDLALLTTCYIGLRAKAPEHLHLAVVLGAIQDCFSAWPLGHFAFLYGAAAYVVCRLRRYLPPDSPVSHMVAALFCGMVVSVLGLVLALVSVGAGGGGFAITLLRALVSAAAAPILFDLWERSRLFRRAFPGSGYRFAP